MTATIKMIKKENELGAITQAVKSSILSAFADGTAGVSKPFDGITITPKNRPPLPIDN
jgi:hypothetical protein